MLRRTTLATLVALVLLLTGLLVSTALAQPFPRQFIFETAMSGAEEVCTPSNLCADPNAMGTAELEIQPGHKTVCYDLSWQDVDGTVLHAHIHVGPEGVAGPIVVPLFVNQSFSGTGGDSGCVSADSRTLAQIIAKPDQYYVNVHSSTFPAGAVRGQLD